MGAYTERPGGLVVHVRVQPRASRNEITGIQDGRLRLRITAPPVEGAANEACRKLLAEVLGLPRSAIRLIAGQKAREKSFEISGDSDALKARLATFEESV